MNDAKLKFSRSIENDPVAGTRRAADCEPSAQSLLYEPFFSLFLSKIHFLIFLRRGLPKLLSFQSFLFHFVSFRTTALFFSTLSFFPLDLVYGCVRARHCVSTSSNTHIHVSQLFFVIFIFIIFFLLYYYSPPPAAHLRSFIFDDYTKFFRILYYNK